VVLLRSIENTSDALMVAEKIRNAMNKSFDLAQQSLHISCSIGLVMYPEQAKTGSEMLGYADIAMYRAKQSGRDNVQVFESS